MQERSVVETERAVFGPGGGSSESLKDSGESSEIM